jgi:hypothetical protein
MDVADWWRGEYRESAAARGDERNAEPLDMYRHHRYGKYAQKAAGHHES